MPKITSIKKQKNGKRLNIYLDEKFSFGIDLDNFVRFDLKIDKELTQEAVEEIVYEAEFSSTLEKLINFATTRPRSKKEIRDWFYKKKVHESMQDELISKLIRYDLVGDEQFAKWWVEQRNRFRPRSIRQLAAELRQKGIDKKIIEEVLMESEVDELSIARKLVDKNMRKWKGLDDFEQKKKISAYLGRKGFSWDVISEIIDG